MASIPVNYVIILSFISLLVYLLGIHNVITNVDTNSCEMTYMFEFPQYVEISLPESIQKDHPRYALYGYSEGSATETLRRKQFTGVPVLYIPGNSGSHKQGRSLASVALRKAYNSRSAFHFDFFLADFNEDLSGIYGGALKDHTLFVQFAIDKILSLYSKGPFTPDSVILIGHSAGGVVAKNLFTAPTFNKKLVKLVITLATPHAAPVLHADHLLPSIYGQISRTWVPRTSNVSHVTLVSIGGGNRDLIVRSDLIKDPVADINVLSTSVPGVWCSMDHLSITWCKQLILTITRALFDSIDPKTKQLIDNTTERVDIFKYHLVKRSDGKKFGRYSVRSSFERKVKWIENLQRQFSIIEKNGLRNPQFIMLRLFDDPKHAAALIEAVNINVKDWVFVCNADSIEDDFRVCDDGINLSNLTEIRPSQGLRRKTVMIDMLDLKNKGFSHVLIRFPPLSSYMEAHIDVHNPADRSIVYEVPRISSLTTETILESTINNAVHYSITLAGFDQVWQAFQFGLETLTCKTSASHSVVTFSVPWANEDQSFFLVKKNSTYASLKLVTPRPPKSKFDSTAFPKLTFTLDPSCKYKITIAPDKIAVAGQLARYYSQLLPGYIAAILLMTLRAQIQSYEEGNGVTMFHNGLTHAVRKYYLVLQTCVIGSRILGMSLFDIDMLTPDTNKILNQGLDFFLLPILLFLVATAIVYIAGAIVYGAIIVSGQTANKLAFRFLARTVTGATSISEWVFSAFYQLPIIAAAVLASLAWSTSGGLSMALTACFYFLTLCKLYDEYLEELFKKCLRLIPRALKNITGGSAAAPDPKKEAAPPLEQSALPPEANADGQAQKPEQALPMNTVKEDNGNEPAENEVVGSLGAIHFQVTVCLLFMLAAATTIPSVLAWSRSFHENTQLTPDPFWLSGILLPVLGCLFWYGVLPEHYELFDKTWISSSTVIIYSFAALCIMYGSLSVYRLPYLIILALCYVGVYLTITPYLFLYFFFRS